MATCELCNGTKHIFKEGTGWTRCPCWYDARARRIMGEAKFPVPLLDIEAKAFVIGNQSQRKLLASAIQDEVTTYNKKPFFIYSQSQEKEKVAAIITRYLIKKHTEIETARFIKLDAITEQYFSKDMEDGIASAEDVDLLTLVLGDELTNKAHLSILFNLLYNRSLNEKFTLVLSFVPKEMIKIRYDERIYRFFEENYKFYEC